MGQLAGLSAVSLFGINKPLTRAWHLGTGPGFLRYREKDTLEKVILCGALLDLFTAYHLMMPWQFGWDFLTGYFTFYGGLLLNWGDRETVYESASTLKTLFRQSFFLSDLYGGAGATLSLFSFYLGLGLGINTGYLLFSDLMRDPVVNSESIVARHYFMIGLGADLWLGWMINQAWSVNIKWRIRKPWLIGSSNSWEKHLQNQITFSLGHRFL